jgi:hypothetical protein
MKSVFHITILSILFIAACAGSRQDGEIQMILGKIQIIGNEPFAQLAIEDKTETVYILKCSEDIENQLLELQGQWIRLYCSEIVIREKQNTATVTQFETIIENE